MYGLCRSGVFQVATLRAELPGGDMTMLYLRSYLTDRCPARKAHGTEQCQAVLKPVKARNGTPGR